MGSSYRIPFFSEYSGVAYADERRKWIEINIINSLNTTGSLKTVPFIISIEN